MVRGAPEGEGGGMKGAGVSRAGLSSAQWVGREAPAEQPGPRTMPQMSPLVRESCNKGAVTRQGRYRLGSRHSRARDSNEGLHKKVSNHGKGPYLGLLLVTSGYYHFHI